MNLKFSGSMELIKNIHKKVIQFSLLFFLFQFF